ncbi:MAG: alpha/beta hydrolase [Thiolinea sp.]
MSKISDWDDAYANAPYIPQAERYRPAWAEQAAQFRAEHRHDADLSYGNGEREKLDLFHPATEAQGLLVFVHGGYWLAFDKSGWSHLAAGALQRGWAVALPSYPLAPEARIADMTACIGRAINFAASRVAGPLCLAGHSAGGHLVSRMVCRLAPGSGCPTAPAAGGLHQWPA